MPAIEAARFVFLDETGVTTSLVRTYGRSPRGKRLRDDAPLGHWQSHTILAAVRVDGLTAPAVFPGPLDNASVLAFVQQVLVPTRRVGEPDLNPIEMAFAKLKAFLRATRPRTFDQVCAHVAAALGLFTSAHDAENRSRFSKHLLSR